LLNFTVNKKQFQKSQTKLENYRVKINYTRKDGESKFSFYDPDEMCLSDCCTWSSIYIYMARGARQTTFNHQASVFLLKVCLNAISTYNIDNENFVPTTLISEESSNVSKGNSAATLHLYNPDISNEAFLRKTSRSLESVTYTDKRHHINKYDIMFSKRFLKQEEKEERGELLSFKRQDSRLESRASEEILTIQKLLRLRIACIEN
jgi:hypothetical protein